MEYLTWEEILVQDRDEARNVARRLYRRVQELEARLADALEAWGKTITDKNKMIGDEVGDVDALIAALAHIICHNRLRRGWLLPGLSASLRERVEAAAKAEWDAFVGRRG